ncbi:MAG: ion channel [Maricaulaceae bacterium]
MVAALLLSAILVVAVVAIHFAGLVGIARLRDWDLRRFHGEVPQRIEAARILIVVLALLALHGVQIWLFAIAYSALDLFETFEASLYFSASSFSTVGYGDVVLGPPWRLLGAIESAAGFLLIGWSTAFLVTIAGHMVALKRDAS